MSTRVPAYLAAGVGRPFAPTAATAVRWRLVGTLDEVLRAVLIQDGLEELALSAWLDAAANGSNTALGTQWSLGSLELETDMAAAVNGELVLGEAKSMSAFSDLKQVDRLVRLASLLEARRLIFATSESMWTPASRKRIESAAATEPGVRVEIYTNLLDATGPKALI